MQEFMGQLCMELRRAGWPSREAYLGGRSSPGHVEMRGLNS
jgi:hypothetical protein